MEDKNMENTKTMKNYKVNVDWLDHTIYFEDDDRGVYEIVDDMLDAWRLQYEIYDIKSYEIEEHTHEKDELGDYCDKFFAKLIKGDGEIKYINIDVYEDKEE